ncbi:MAG TPA: DUF1269 domain-containing protein [Caldilineaceae bacterium]|nr:DUF1269 domain-containing protein [Caldilineaceae bacterium]
MTTLTAFKFNTPDGADRMSGLLQGLQRQQLITVHDAAVVSWPQGKKKPKTRQLHNMAGIGALDGAFWGMLFGLLFFVPFLGLAIGAGIGAMAGAFADVGIDDKFIKQVQSKVTEGTSALFLLTSGAVMDRVMEAIKAEGLQPELIASNLSAEEESKLQSAFAAETEGGSAA